MMTNTLKQATTTTTAVDNKIKDLGDIFCGYPKDLHQTKQTPKVHQIVLGTPLLIYFVSAFIVKINYFSHPFIMYFTCTTECISAQQLV